MMTRRAWSLEVIRQVWEPPWSTPGPCPYHYPLTPACRQSSVQRDFAGPLAGWSCQTRRRSGRAGSSVREVDVRADARRR